MCEFIKENEKCNCKIKYGNFCYKHRSEFLIKDSIIDINNYTGKLSDYLKNDIISTILKINDNICISKNMKKDKLFSILDHEFQKFNDKYKFINEIKYIQKIVRGFIIRKKFNKKLMINKCNNDTDFYTFDKLTDIDDKFFYCYKDINNFVWGFDIRSFNKLIELNQNNPYNCNKIPENEKIKCMEIIETLKKNNEFNNDIHNEIKKTKKQILKQGVVDLFSEIEQYGYTCNINWFLKLRNSELKKLYRLLEDIWNYRLQLTQEIKNEIVPPNGLIFNIPIITINSYVNQVDLQSVILNEIKKFGTSDDVSNRKLGYMYFLIGLGSVSRECYLAHYQWLMYIN
tara:strand:- start:610 stop:1638 length:1029 start_codon:yes stop_codon:yes gene_type:complete